MDGVTALQPPLTNQTLKFAFDERDTYKSFRSKCSLHLFLHAIQTKLLKTCSKTVLPQNMKETVKL